MKKRKENKLFEKMKLFHPKQSGYGFNFTKYNMDLYLLKSSKGIVNSN